MDTNKISLIAMLVSAIIISIHLVIESITFNRDAMHWWNNISHYGRTILMNNNFNMKYRFNEEVPKKYIHKLYSEHLKKKQV